MSLGQFVEIVRMYGYNGKILKVDLSKGTIRTEKPEESFYRLYLGGRGLIAYYLLRELKPKVDPLGPENLLIFALGVITGAPIAGSGRNGVGAKSPLTGAYGEAEAGGFWGAELKHAGFDAIIVKGRAEEPVFLWVYDGEAELRDARHLWGLNIGDSQEAIRKELGDRLIRTTQIGPGGENMVRFACVVNDLKHTAGRVGMGAVMGAKRLKAVAVRGHGGPETADPERLKELNRWLLKNLEKKSSSLHKFGTGAMMDVYVESGNLPVRNFRESNFTNVGAISAQTIKETVRVKMEGCYACPVRCKKVVQTKEPWVVEPIYGGPEYETLAALGSNCGVDDLNAVCKANELCQRYSLDTISTGDTIAFAMECFEKGLLTEEDTSGVDLSFGNGEAVVTMVEMIAKREGLGDLLAEGSMRAAAKIGKGAEKWAVHVKGEEVPLHDPRLKVGLGIGYSVKPTGADHCNSLHDSGAKDFRPFGIFEPVSALSLGPEKVRLYIYWVNWHILDNCLVMCNFLPWDVDQTVQIVAAVTGWDTTSWELAKVGERSINMARAFNVREGFTPKDDWLPERFFQPKAHGPLAEMPINPKELKDAINNYYRMMGWDEKTGIPSTAKLQELGISWVAKEMKMASPSPT